MTRPHVPDKPVETLVEGHGHKATRRGVRPVVTVIHPPTGSGWRLCACLVRPPTMGWGCGRASNTSSQARASQPTGGRSSSRRRCMGPTWSRAASCRLSCRSSSHAWPTSCWPWNAPVASRPPSTTSFLMPGRMTCAPARVPRRDLPPRLRSPDPDVNDGSATSAAPCTPAYAAVVFDGRSVLGWPTRCFQISASGSPASAPPDGPARAIAVSRCCLTAGPLRPAASGPPE
jgi:hypothetical protein